MKLMVLLASLILAVLFCWFRLTAAMQPQGVITQRTLGPMPSITPAPIATAQDATWCAVADITGK